MNPLTNRACLLAPLRAALAVLSAAAAVPAAVAADAPPRCEARSGPQAVRVVELYTSEGCNSCPPADRWLSTLHPEDGVVALAFHVDYWDRLGWVDRFADPAHTARQRAAAAAGGARFIYTPQVLADGRDWRGWPGLPVPAPVAESARVDVALTRQGGQIEADIRPGPTAPSALGGFWAVVEDGHVSTVRAGENVGVTLHHDHVVRHLEPLPAFSGALRARHAAPPAPAEAGARVRTVLVVTEMRTGRALQAVSLACPG